MRSHLRFQIEHIKAESVTMGNKALLTECGSVNKHWTNLHKSHQPFFANCASLPQKRFHKDIPAVRDDDQDEGDMRESNTFQKPCKRHCQIC